MVCTRAVWSNLCPRFGLRQLDLLSSVVQPGGFWQWWPHLHKTRWGRERNLRQNNAIDEGLPGVRGNTGRTLAQASMILRPSNCHSSAHLKSFMHELRADCLFASTSHEQFHFCISGLWLQRKGKKIPNFFPPREGSASLQHFLHGQTPSSKGQKKIVL